MKKDRIIITVEGGIVQDVTLNGKKTGAFIEVHDYDCDVATDGDRIKYDDEGTPFWLSSWEV